MQFVDTREGNIFNVWLSANSLSTGGPNDIFNILAPTKSRVQLLEVRIGQSSTNPTAIQSLGVSFFSGSSSSGAGATITAYNTKQWTGAPTAGTSVTGPSTTIASTTSATLLYAGAYDAAAGTFVYRPNEQYGVPLVITNGQRFHIRVTTPQLPVVSHGTLTFKEIGYGAPA